MRLISLGLLCISMLLAGCSSAPQAPPKKPQQSFGVEPVTAQPSSLLKQSDAQIAHAFLTYYRQQPLYQSSSPDTLSAYNFHTRLSSPDGHQQFIVMRKSTGHYGLIAWSLGANSVMSSLRLRDPQLGTRYFLLIRPGRLCFVTEAGRPPYWLNGWQYGQRQPGRFSCNGLTNRSAFIPGSQLPGKLGAYYEDGDLVLVFNTPSQRDQIAAQLLQLFPQLRLFP